MILQVNHNLNYRSPCTLTLRKKLLLIIFLTVINVSTSFSELTKENATINSTTNNQSGNQWPVVSELTTLRIDRREDIDVTTTTTTDNGLGSIESIDSIKSETSESTGLRDSSSSEAVKVTSTSSSTASPSPSSSSSSSPSSISTEYQSSSSFSLPSSSPTPLTSDSSSNQPSPRVKSSESLAPSSSPVKENFTEIASRRDETHKRKVNGGNPVDDIIGSIIQLIGGNVKLSRPPITPRPMGSGNGLPQPHMGPPPGRPMLIPRPIPLQPQQPPPHPPPPPQQQQQPQGSANHPSRINNRGPPKVAYVGANGGSPFPPNVLIGPGQPAGLPIPIPAFNQPYQVPQQNPRPLEHIPSARPPPPNRDPDESEHRPNEIGYNNRKPIVTNDGVNDLNSIGSGVEVNKHHGQQNQQNPNQRFGGQPSVMVQGESVNSASFDDPPNRHQIPSIDSSTPISSQSTKVNSFNKNSYELNEGLSPINRTTVLEPSIATLNEDFIVRPGLSSSVSPSTNSISTTPLPDSISTSEKSDSIGSTASVPSGPVTAWLPFFVQPSVSSSKVTWSDEPPPIITKPEEPSVFDITVKHKIGPNSARVQDVPKITPTRPVETPMVITPTSVINQMSSSSSAVTPPLDDFSISTSSSDSSSESSTITASPSSSSTEVSRTIEPGRSSSNSTRILFPSRPVTNDPEPDIVYGRPANKDHGGPGNRGAIPHKPTYNPGYPPPSKPINNPHNRIPVTTKELARPLIPTSVVKPSTASSTAMLGRPIVIPVEVDEVRPNIGGRGGGGGGGSVGGGNAGDSQGTPDVLTEPGQGSVFIDGKPTYFKIRPGPPKPVAPTMQVGSGVTINVDNPPGPVGGNKPLPPSPQSQVPVAGLPGNPSTISGTGSRSSGSISPSSSSSSSPSVVRRPPFRPRPNTPLVRIDTCIVGDDSTCGANLNEHCKTEVGISSCQCKPGYGRTTTRGMCTPVASLGVFLRVDKLGESKIVFNRKLMDPDTEEFQYLEYEALQALNSLFTSSRLGKVFKGAKVNKFYSMGGKTVANATIELDRTNGTRSATIKRIVQQELVRVIASNNNRLGDSQLSVEASLHAIPKVDDINECANSELNDCSKFAVCINEFGSYRCTCRPGYEDKFPGDPVRSGRQCATCSPAYCSNRGECVISNGEKECRCRGNFIGSRCDIDGEVLGVALGGSVAALVIIIITFLCLYMWNQRWKREQQKMEAMSSGSGQTFSYVNKTQAAANYRCGLDDRARWATMAQTLPVNPNYNYYVNPEQLMATSQQHVYATPGRAQTPDALINDDACPVDSRHYPRPIRSKSRASLAPGAYSTMGYGAGSVYNETEFSTRETIYTPSHVIIPPRTKYSPYN